MRSLQCGILEGRRMMNTWFTCRMWQALMLAVMLFGLGWLASDILRWPPFPYCIDCSKLAVGTLK